MARTTGATMKQPSKAELREQIKALEEKLAESAESENSLIAQADIKIWEASNSEPPSVCISIGGDELPLSINVYQDEDGAPVGITVFDDADIVYAQGHLPAELLLQEIAYVRRHS